MEKINELRSFIQKIFSTNIVYCVEAVNVLNYGRWGFDEDDANENRLKCTYFINVFDAHNKIESKEFEESFFIPLDNPIAVEIKDITRDSAFQEFHASIRWDNGKITNSHHIKIVEYIRNECLKRAHVLKRIEIIKALKKYGNVDIKWSTIKEQAEKRYSFIIEKFNIFPIFPSHGDFYSLEYTIAESNIGLSDASNKARKNYMKIYIRQIDVDMLNHIGQIMYKNGEIENGHDTIDSTRRYRQMILNDPSISLNNKIHIIKTLRDAGIKDPYLSLIKKPTTIKENVISQPSYVFERVSMSSYNDTEVSDTELYMIYSLGSSNESSLEANLNANKSTIIIDITKDGNYIRNYSGYIEYYNGRIQNSEHYVDPVRKYRQIVLNHPSVSITDKLRILQIFKNAGIKDPYLSLIKNKNN